jgi:DNA-binding NtrC family response regulator
MGAADPKHDATLTTLTDGSGSAGETPLFALRVTKGADANKAIVLDWSRGPEALVGQSRVCDLALTDPRVSRRHIALSPHGALVRVADMRSSNGTRVSGVRVADALLEGGETIEIGDTTLRLVRAGAQPAPPAPPRDRYGRVLGASHDMRRVFAMCDRLAHASLPIVVEGETGTGKELLAEAIHEGGPRAAGPFVVFDCSAHAADQQLAALFGAQTPGAVEQAHGGTLVIDEVSDLALAVQPRLAATVERGELTRATGGRALRVDVRFVTTTRRDLERDVADGALREELLFRLAGARIRLPPLRERHGDVEVLARHFWRILGGEGEIPKAFVLALARSDWPGNVRELEHAVLRRIALGDDLEAPLSAAGRRAQAGGPQDLIERVVAMDLPMQRARQLVVDEFERRYVERAVAQHGGNVSRAAAASGLTRRYFHMLRAKGRT